MAICYLIYIQIAPTKDKIFAWYRSKCPSRWWCRDSNHERAVSYDHPLRLLTIDRSKLAIEDGGHFSLWICLAKSRQFYQDQRKIFIALRAENVFSRRLEEKKMFILQLLLNFMFDNIISAENCLKMPCSSHLWYYNFFFFAPRCFYLQVAWVKQYSHHVARNVRQRRKHSPKITRISSRNQRTWRGFNKQHL